MSVRNTVKSIQDIMRQDSGVDGDAQRISQLCWMFFLKIIDDQDQELELDRAGLADLRRLCDAAFGDRFNDSAWEHALGGTHYVVCEEGRFLSHAAVVTRTLSVESQDCRTGFVR